MHERWNILGMQNPIDLTPFNGGDLADILIYGHNRFHDRNKQEVYQVGSLKNRLNEAYFNGLDEDMVRSMVVSHFVG